MQIFLILSILINLILTGILGYQIFGSKNAVTKNQILQTNLPLFTETINSFITQSVNFDGQYEGASETSVIIQGLDKKNRTFPLMQGAQFHKLEVLDGKAAQTDIKISEIPKGSTVGLYATIGTDFKLKVVTITYYPQGSPAR